MDRPVLVTGAAGFAGSHLLALLGRSGQPLAAWRRPGGRPPSPWSETAQAVRWVAVDLLDRPTVTRAIAELRPSAIYHCAGAAHVPSSWDRTGATFQANVLGTHHLIEAVRQAGLDCAILVPGSALVYQESDRPLAEDDPLEPASPYALSKLAQEMLGARAATDDGLRVLLARPFNHLGPGQDPSFAASSFAWQIARIEAGLAEPLVRVGNLEARRDFTDVRDTVRAYQILTERGRPARPYNVCSGLAFTMRDVLDMLLAEARVPVQVDVQTSLLRPRDQPALVGSPERIRAELGWTPQIPIRRTLADLLGHWRERVAADIR